MLKFSQKIPLVVLIFALLTMSCNLGSILEKNSTPQSGSPQTYTPGKSNPARLVDQQPGGFYFIELPDEFVQEHVTVDRHLSEPAQTLTDEFGIAAFEDVQAGLRFATTVADEQGKPLSNMEVSYYPGDSNIRIVITDPSGEYFPKLLVIERDDLISTSPFHNTGIDDVMGVQLAKAEIFTISAILVILGKALIVATLAKATYEIKKLEVEEAINLEDVIQGIDGLQYDCMSPDLITSRFEPGVTMAFLLVPGGKGAKEVTTIVAHGTDLIAGG